jgi:type VI protein secretion system component Hcp
MKKKTRKATSTRKRPRDLSARKAVAVKGGTGAGKVKVQDIHVTSSIDKASP